MERNEFFSPKDMDFLNVKNSAARDIALAFGVPAHTLIPGDNTYSNLAEARLALWEQTIIPLLENTTSALNNWLTPMFGGNIQISYDKNAISALLPRRESLWKRISEADFLSPRKKGRWWEFGSYPRTRPMSTPARSSATPPPRTPTSCPACSRLRPMQ